MSFLDVIMGSEPWVAHYTETPTELQPRAKDLCWEFNNTKPSDKQRQRQILLELFGESASEVIIQPSFHCDYGFNVHFHGFAFINYNCVMLDTSPINIGEGVFIAPNVVLACPSHATHPKQRCEYELSAPITIGDKVWLGANVTVCGGIKIGSGSIIGAGSVVTRNIPENVVAVGSPCKPIREITEKDLLMLDNK